MNLHINILTILVIDILKYKYISNGVIFHCCKNNIAQSLHKIFNKHNIKVSNVNIDTNSSYFISPHFHTKSVFILNTSCEDWAEVLDTNAVSLQKHTFIIITDHLSLTTDVLSQYPIPVDSDVTVVHKNNSTIDLYEVYNTGFYYNGTFNINKLWYLYSQKSLRIEKHNRNNLQGLRIRVAVIVLPIPKIADETVEQYMEKPWTQTDIVHRMKFFILLKYMTNMYNVSYDLHRVSSWGYSQNGTFDGLVGALHDGMADIGGAPCFFRRDRADFVDYISEVWLSRQSIIFRYPKHPGGFYSIYSRPLTNVVWCCVVALLALTAVMMWLMFRVQRNQLMGQDSSLSLAGLVIWGAVCQQGTSVRWESTSVKLATFVTFLYAVTLYQYYNATIVSSLLMEPPRTIRTLKDVLDSDLKVGIEDIIYNKDFFKRTTDPVAIELYKRKVHTIHQYNFFKAEEGLALVKKGGFAFHVDTAVAFPIIKHSFREREICDIQLVQLFPLQKCGVVIRKNSPYKEHISYGIRKMYEAGLLHRILSVMDEPKPRCSHTPDTSLYCVSIREFSTPLMTLTFGIICSLVILMAEVVVSKIDINKKLTAFRHQNFAFRH